VEAVAPLIKQAIASAVAELAAASGLKFDYRIGTMIEVRGGVTEEKKRRD
jgi:hypothetical protein